jgi:hypothetical protein
MPDRETTLWCPHCAKPTRHAPLPQLASDEELIEQLSSSADPRGLFRRHYCLACRGIWRSVQLPQEFVEQLLSFRPKIDDLKREIALLRFLLAHHRRTGTLLDEAA